MRVASVPLPQWKNESCLSSIASGGIRTHNTLYSRHMLYQQSYQGSPAGMYTCMYRYICMYVCADIHVCMYVQMYKYICMYRCTCMYVSTNVHVHVFMYLQMYMYVCMYRCTCIHIYMYM